VRDSNWDETRLQTTASIGINKIQLFNQVSLLWKHHEIRVRDVYKANSSSFALYACLTSSTVSKKRVNESTKNGQGQGAKYKYRPTADLYKRARRRLAGS
jgi:hypothetical protein